MKILRHFDNDNWVSVAQELRMIHSFSKDHFSCFCCENSLFIVRTPRPVQGLNLSADPHSLTFVQSSNNKCGSMHVYSTSMLLPGRTTMSQIYYRPYKCYLTIAHYLTYIGIRLVNIWQNSSQKQSLA